MFSKIVLTGAGGKLGRRMRAPLAKLCARLVSTDILPLQTLGGNEVVTTADLTDLDAVRALVQGVDAVVHFAGYPREADWQTIIPANIVTATNLWEAALQAGVGRIVYASSNHVMGFHPVTRHINPHDEVKCDSRYGVSKAFTETLARFYYEKYGLASLGIRIGRCEDAATDERMLSTWIHPDDLAQLVALGLRHPVRADIVYGISRNTRAWCSNPPAAQFPYAPEHSADTYAATIEQGAPVASWRYQGGPFADADYRGDQARAADNFRENLT